MVSHRKKSVRRSPRVTRRKSVRRSSRRVGSRKSGRSSHRASVRRSSRRVGSRKSGRSLSRSRFRFGENHTISEFVKILKRRNCLVGNKFEKRYDCPNADSLADLLLLRDVANNQSANLIAYLKNQLKLDQGGVDLILERARKSINSYIDSKLLSYQNGQTIPILENEDNAYFLDAVKDRHYFNKALQTSEVNDYIHRLEERLQSQQ